MRYSIAQGRSLAHQAPAAWRCWPLTLVLRAVFISFFSPLSRVAGEFFHAVRNDFRQLHHLLAQFGLFHNVALNAIAIGLQFSPERLKLTEETINFAHRSL